MTLPAILTDFRQRGVTLFRRGDELRYRARKGAITPEMIDCLRTHKQEILAAIPTPEEVLTWTFADVDRRRVRIKIRSRLLGCDLWFVAADDPGPGDGLPVYTTTEVRELLKLRPENLPDAVQRTHIAKMSLGPNALVEEVIPA